MRHRLILPLAMALSALAVGPIGCTSSSWCVDCAQATTLLGLNYQPTNTYSVGTPIPVNPPNPSGGTPRVYELASGTLPPGLSLDPTTGQITGTPTAAGVYSLTIRGTNSANSASQTIQITVLPAQPLALSYATPLVFPAAMAMAIQTPTLTQTTPGIPTTYATTTGNLPAGLTLNSDGTISGTPTTPGIYPFTVTAINGTRTAAASATYTVTPAGSLRLSYATPQTFAAGIAVATQSPALVNPTPGMPTTYAVTTGQLPAGLSLNATNGAITGAPTTPGVFAFTVTATHGTRTATSSPTYTVTSATPLTVAYATPKTFTAGTAIVMQAASLTDATPGVATTYTLSGGTLPAGLNLDATTGAITGTPTTAGVFTFTVAATNGTRNATASAAYTILPSVALSLGYMTPQTFGVGAAIATQVPTLTNATPGVTTTYTVTSGIIPAGLTLNADGTITGNPTTPGVYTFTVTATNGTRPATSSPTYTVTPASALTVGYTPQTFPAGTAIISQAPTIANTTPGVTTTFAVTSGTLPAGLILNTDGTITGNPTTPGVYAFTVTATNGTRTATSSPTYTVTPASALTVGYTPQTFPVGTAIATQTPAIANTTPGVTTTFAVTTGALPAGLILTADGTITGNPTTPGVYAFTVTATNGTRTATSSPTYTVTPASALIVGYTPQTFPTGTVIASQAPTIANTTPGVTTTFAVTSGVLPAGLTLNADGTITGNPTTPGVVTFTVTATNGTRTATSSPTYTVTPVAALTASYPTPQTFISGTVIATQTPTITNATPGVTTTFAVTSGTLPAGLILNADGTIAGNPTTPGVYAFTVTTTNGTRTATSSPTYTVTPAAALTGSYATPQTFTAGTAIATQTPTITNATPGVTTTFAVTSGTLPAGLILNTDGTITGNPTTPGVYAFTVMATNGTRTATSSPTYTVTPAAALTASYATPQTFTVGTAIATQTPAVTNATPGVTTTFAVTSGVLPAGLTLNADGTITGNPTTPGVYAFTVTATNGTRTAASSPTYTINGAPTSLNYTTPVTYNEQSAIAPNLPSPAGGTPTSYAVTLGTLPAGLTLNAGTGIISGTPTGPTAGSVSVTIRGTNAFGNASEVVVITVAPTAPTSLHYITPATYTNGTPITANTPAPVGGTPSSYAVTSGILPAGLSFNPNTGVISGTPTAPTGGAILLTITGTNTAGSISQVISITVNNTATTALNYTTPNTYVDGTPILVNNPNPTGGTPSGYIITAGSLPAGLTLDPVTGVISGTPTAPVSNLSVTIQGTNAAGNASKPIVNTVNAAAPTALHYSTPVIYTLGVPILNDPNPVGGTPTTYTITAGALPSGLALNALSGVISGTPTAVTGSPLSVTIRGANGSGNASQTLSISVPAPIVASFSGNPLVLPVGQAANLTALFSGGAGTIDHGLGTITSGATVSTPVQNSPTSITYTLTVSNGNAPQNVTAPVTIQWIAPTSQLVLHIPDTGGVSTTDITDPSDPFYGVKVSVPAMTAVCSATDLTLMKEVALPGTVAAPVEARSQTFNLSTTVGYPFRQPITVTLPYDATSLTAADVPVPFYWDSTYSKWVANGLKSIDTTNHLITFTTLLPGRYVVMVIPGLAGALADKSTGFVAGTDAWFQPNQGVFDLPGGSSFGMSSFASWYFSQEKVSNGNAGLNTLFRQGPIASDDVNARALISRLANGTLEGWSAVVDQSKYQLTDTQTGLALITALRVTNQPQIFLMGEARPALLSALATVVYAYNNTTKRFSVMDPNYPGATLGITWAPTAPGSFSSYDRGAGYFPAFTAYAMEGHTSIHRLVDYERAFQGANTGWTNPPFATITLNQVGNLVSPALNGNILQLNASNNVTISGTITGGDTTATHVFWSQNGGERTAISLGGGSTFTFTIPALVDPYNTTVMLETSANPCDPTFAHTGFQEFSVKDQALQPWFLNSCFEAGTSGNPPVPLSWTLQQGSNGGVFYPASPTWSPAGVLNSYAVSSWAVSPIDSALVTVGNDQYIPSIPQVLDGTAAFRVNNPATGSHMSRIFQTVTVPTSIDVPKLSFYWAAVLEDNGHPAEQQPYVDVLIQDVTDPANVTVVYYKHFYAGDPAYPGWITGANGVGGSPTKGIPWQKVNLANLTALKGHSLKITVTAADCTQGGHGGYAYLDNTTCN